ncbi:shikimate kinase, partial [Cellulomonas citrea]|uniref:shikimate kinase n=1 Tax=Cellulomonas citrea TaxID=1909423 RepID=UPI001916286D
MGVSGSGKSTVGRALAHRLDLPFAEGDDFHPAANVAAMAAGRPLTDADRAPWLAALADWIG